MPTSHSCLTREVATIYLRTQARTPPEILKKCVIRILIIDEKNVFNIEIVWFENVRIILLRFYNELGEHLKPLIQFNTEVETPT